jgi:hypothetical protein
MLNEQIRELAQQALNEVTGNGPRELEVALGPFEIKFAELLVLECANHLSDRGEFNSAENIKTLFGVE